VELDLHCGVSLRHEEEDDHLLSLWVLLEMVRRLGGPAGWASVGQCGGLWLLGCGPPILSFIFFPFVSSFIFLFYFLFWIFLVEFKVVLQVLNLGVHPK
jgi:hypothetical protein